MSIKEQSNITRDIYNSGILSSKPAITYTVDGVIVRTSDDE